MNPWAEQLKKSFKDKEYRHGYVDDFLNTSIATQIKVLRERRDWSQEELADKAGMKQPTISRIENVNYSSWSINTLRKIAEAFDLTLLVTFESFGTRLKDISRFSRKALEKHSFEEDPVFKEKEEVHIVVEVGDLAGVLSVPLLPLDIKRVPLRIPWEKGALSKANVGENKQFHWLQLQGEESTINALKSVETQ